MSDYKIQFSFLVFLIPIVHVIANITTNYFPESTVNPGFFRLIYLVIVLLLYFIIFKPPYKNLFIVVVIFLIYNLILVLLNQNLLNPIINFVRLSIPFLLFFVGYSAIYDHKKLILLFKFFMIGLLFFIGNYIIANVFGIGPSFYLDDSFYIGGAGSGSANELAIFTLIAITFLLVNKEKKWTVLTFILVAASIIIIFLNMRRGAFLTLGIAALLYIYIIGINWRLSKYVITAAIVLLAAFPLYGDVLIERYNYRVESREGSLANLEIEARYMELERVPASLSREQAWLFGTHNLNSATYFGGRELHVGYMAILHGSGILGICLFILIILLIYNKGRKVFKKETENYFENRALHALYMSLIAAILIYMLTSRIHGFGLNTPTLLMLGALLGYVSGGKQIKNPK